MLLQGLAGSQEVVDVGERLLSVLAAAYQLNGHEVYSTASIGIVIGYADYQRAGLISDLGTWALRTACRQFAIWPELGPAAPAKLSLNLSRRQFVQPQLAKLIRETLQEFDIAPSSIELEVSEDDFCDDLRAASLTLQSLRSLGLKLTIDHFGVGRSSFAALHRFPVDTLKIDRSLLTDFPNSQETAALIQGLVVIANRLSFELVVEGVENRSQSVALQELGCKLAQGFYFSRPMSAESIPQFMYKQMSPINRFQAEPSCNG